LWAGREPFTAAATVRLQREMKTGGERPHAPFVHVMTFPNSTQRRTNLYAGSELRHDRVFLHIMCLTMLNTAN